MNDGCVVDHDAWLLRRVVEAAPHIALFGEEQATDQGRDEIVARRKLLKVGVRIAEPPGDRAALVTAELVDVSMDAAVVRMPGDRIDEGGAGLVQLTRPNDLLRQVVGMVGKEVLGEGRLVGGSAGIFQTGGIERQGDGLRSPKVNVRPVLFLDR